MAEAADAFNAQNALPYEITIPIGDWSDDGHGKCRDITILSSHPADRLQEAYRQSVAATGLSFNPQDAGTISLFVEYEDRHISSAALAKLSALGFDTATLLHEEGQYSLMPNNKEGDYHGAQALADMILWFIRLSLPELEYQRKTPTYLNGYWGKLKCHFG